MKNHRKKAITLILSFIYSIFIIIGTSFLISDSFEFLFSRIFLSLALFIFLVFIIYFILNKLFDKLDSKKIKFFKFKRIKMSKLYDLFQKHTFLFSLIFMIICWMPYIIGFYPAILSPDPSFQIRQFFHIPNKYSDYSIMLDPNVTITNHHPVIHTLLLGFCVKIGTIINNVNLGLFLYSIIQILILSSTLSYTIKFLKDIKLKDNYLIFMLLVYSFLPIFPFYSMSSVKDVIFGSFVILYIISLYKLIKKDNILVSDMFKLFILFILIMLFRNNGFHTIILSLPLLLFIKKNYVYKLKTLVLVVFVLLFNFSYNDLILPYFKVTPSSVREMLSIPFQQTARYVKEHNNEVTEEEKSVIDKVLSYDTLSSRYDSDLADPVKNKFNKYATDEDLKNYFNVWLEELKKHPVTYIEATISNTYGYYYPLKLSWFIYFKFDDRIVSNGFDYHYNGLNILRGVLSVLGNVTPYLPPTCLLLNIGLNVWYLLFMFSYLFYKKKYRYLIYLSPCFVLFLVCIASPANSYFRYALPFVFALLLNAGIFIKEGVIDSSI